MRNPNRPCVTRLSGGGGGDGSQNNIKILKRYGVRNVYARYEYIRLFLCILYVAIQRHQYTNRIIGYMLPEMYTTRLSNNNVLLRYR